MIMKTRFASRGWLGLILGGALLGATTQSGQALNYSKHPKDSPEVNAILAKGRFDDGDSSDLQRYIAKLPKKPLTVVYFDSPGGNLRESMEIGRFLYRNKIATALDPKASCASACALAFLGGRGPDGKPNRVKSSSAKLGVHSFTREFPRDRRYDAGDMKEVLQRAQTEVGVMAEFLREVDVDLDVLRIMMKASNTSMAFLTNDEAIGIGAQVYDEKTKTMIDPAPVLERLAKARLEARIAAAAAPIKLDEPTRVTTTRRSGPVPAAGSSDAPSLTQPVVHREPAVRPTTADRRRPGAGNADSGSR
jgi:hypothetical protein